MTFLSVFILTFININNLALIRATNVIPLDGIVYPISNIPYLEKERGTAFSFAINDLLRKLSIINEDGYWNKKEEEQAKIRQQNDKILDQYLPYSSNYNSMVLWSINGLVPDDINNTFSNKTCAIIENLNEQIGKSELISIVPTDTAIKGNVKLSNKAIILLCKERYTLLSEQEKNQLSKLNLTIKIFDGKLDDAIYETLQNSENYTAEKLSLARSDNGYIKSQTSDEIQKAIIDIAQSHNIAQVLHWNVLTGENDELDKLTSVKDEFEKMVLVKKSYQKTFFKYLFSKLNLDEYLLDDLLRNMESPVYIKELCTEIEKIGLDKYKSVVSEYNSILETLKQQKKLPTPEQIINLKKENRDFDLTLLIDEFEKSQENNKEGLNINPFLKKLQEKYGYSDNSLIILEKVISKIVEHFGKEKEQLILDTILNSEIYLPTEEDKIEEYFNQKFLNMEESIEVEENKKL